MEHFPVELNYLKRNATGNGPPLVKQLRLFLDDDDVMRCQGRLENANVIEGHCLPDFATEEISVHKTDYNCCP